MKLAVLTLAISLAAGGALAASIDSPEAKAAFEGLAPEGRKIAAVTIHAAPDLGAYCATPKEERRIATGVAARELVRAKEIQGAAVGNLVTEVMAYGGVVCTGQ